ncbi:Calx-beta domain-containing protein [Prosthecobacter vanneervenii]|uniref:Calx-beta domain-containing protein n=1 Tax=Prosthecobacter vanneervenii TaxID=48466 RepID=A0A7W7YD20_9BACT|nr:Calx-beta domain-containing protein [Prosthecobacter vanneervenii]MBB5033914.1 hypothetical protein [Prosthecobacter vanneervenii]
MIKILAAWVAFSATVFAGTLNKDVLYVTQVPVPDEILSSSNHDITLTRMSIASAMQNPQATPENAPRGGALWIRYANGTRRNLTNAAGYGGAVDANFNATGFQGASSIAVAHPFMHWSGTKAIFAMVVGAPTSTSDTTVFHWQLYEITNFASGQTPVITLVSGQPTNYNNVYACYDTQDRIIFVSDAPRNLDAALYPQLDEYLSQPTNTGLWRLDRANGNELVQIVHTPSGAFSPFIDSAGRVIFVQWDHLSRDVFATYDRVPNTSIGETWTQTSNGNRTYDSEAANSGYTAGTTANYATYNNYPEPRNFDKTALAAGVNINGLAFNQFFPWECREDGSSHEVQNHAGRHEISPSFTKSFTDDPVLVNSTATGNRTVHMFNVVEDPVTPGRFYATSIPEFGTHSAGSLLSYDLGISTNPDSLTLNLVTPFVNVPNTALGQSPLGSPVSIYRNPTPLSDGTLLAVHTLADQYDNNSGTATSPKSRYSFRLRMLILSGATYVADTSNNPTSPANVSLSYIANGQTLTYSGAPLWELDPVEVLNRSASKPAQLNSAIASVEQGVFDSVGVHAPTFQNYLKTRNLAVVVNRNSTHRDAADKQQPFNLKVSWSSTQTLSSTYQNGDKIYDIGYLQILQSDAIRGYQPAGLPAGGWPGRRIMPMPLHQNLSEMPTVQGTPSGAVKLGTDGSWAAVVPARRAVSWHLMDGTGTKSVIKERYWVNFAPGEVRTCAVCHGVNTKDQANNLGVPTNAPQALVDLLNFWKGNNPPGAVQHASPSAIAQKNAGTASLTVTRTGGSTGPATVSYTTANGIATAGADYTAVSGLLSWLDGDTAPKTISIPVANTATIGASKNLSVTLSSPLYASLGGATTATLTINETPFNAWLYTNLGAAGANAPTAAPAGDADNDGLANLVEYALGSLPGNAASANAPTSRLNGSHLEMTYTSQQSGVTCIPEVSGDLVTWTTDTTDVTPGGSPAGMKVVRDNVASTASSWRFIRLRVTMP